jgi:hypothetical protein
MTSHVAAAAARDRRVGVVAVVAEALRADTIAIAVVVYARRRWSRDRLVAGSGRCRYLTIISRIRVSTSV